MTYISNGGRKTEKSITKAQKANQQIQMISLAECATCLLTRNDLIKEIGRVQQGWINIEESTGSCYKDC